MPTKENNKEGRNTINDKNKKEKYFYGVGRRKKAVAAVKIFEKSDGGEITINNANCEKYFSKNQILLEKMFFPLKLLNLSEKLKIIVRVSGGGPNGQAEAIRLGISKALLRVNEDFKKILKDYNCLTSDRRRVERKKPGLKKARRAPQWKKR